MSTLGRRVLLHGGVVEGRVDEESILNEETIWPS